MLSPNEMLIKEFEKEIWLYLEEGLSEDKKKFWDLKLSESPELRSFLEQNLKTLSVYDNLREEDIPDDILENMINNAVGRQNNLTEFLNRLHKKIEILLTPRFSVSRLVFGLSVLAAAVTLTILFTKSEPLPELSDEMLGWNPPAISSEMQEIEKSILNRDEEWKNYWVRKIIKDDWSKEVFVIEQKINQISRDIDLTTYKK